MPQLPYKSRLPLSVLTLLSFFLPASSNISPFDFIGLVLSEEKPQSDISFIDAFIIVTPLFLFPVISLVIFVRSVMRVSIRKTVLGLPLFLIIFSFAVLSFTGISSHLHLPVSKLVFNMQIGFYLAVIASLVLLFTKNAGRRRRKSGRRSATKEVEVAA